MLNPYNVWWTDAENAFERVPLFRRPVFDRIYKEIREIPQIVSITGPRRVGKSTLIKQIIKKLIEEEGVDPGRIVYYSMDDPALFLSETRHDRMFDSLMEYARKNTKNGLTYVFLDEIQRFDTWELFLKKYYDLDYPVRFVCSGSASSPIFKKSRESLLGRIKDHHILSFSFREFVLYHSLQDPAMVDVLEKVRRTGESVMGMFAKHPEYAELEEVVIEQMSPEFRQGIDSFLSRYLLEGGFPEVWSLPDWETKQAYLFDNQVEKVISEDLVLTIELRKPELLKRFFVSLLQYPGREISFQQLSKDLGINRMSIEKYFPMLEMTDLVHHVEKFTKSALKVRRGNIKCYLVDLALRNSVLRIHESLFRDQASLGLYAENLVLNALKKWEGTVNISYFREKQNEIDFIAHLAAGRYLPIEVKYKTEVNRLELRTLERFCTQHKCATCIVVTRNWDDFGKKENLFYLSLPHFLLLFD